MKMHEPALSRREFLTSSLAAGAVGAAGFSLLGPDSLWAQQTPTPARKMRAALVGTGGRGSSLWGKELLANYGDLLEMVGLCDINPIRLEYAKKSMSAACPTFTDFGQMLNETKPDTVIVTTVDCFHAKYICLAMERGCNVITEKPMCTDEKIQKSGRAKNSRSRLTTATARTPQESRKFC
jgi:hypothetical protein